MKIGIRAWIDFAFRKIFSKPGNETCLISLVNAVLKLDDPVISVEYLNPFSYKEFESDKLVCVDVKATDQQGRVFVIEMQIVVEPSFAKRAVYYACQAYVDQLQTGQSYRELKATYSICLLMRNLWDDSQLHHQFQLVERTSRRVLEDSIEIHTVELAKYNGGKEAIRTATMLEQWVYWIRNSSEQSAQELRELLPDLAFLRATEELVAIQEITEEKQMYDSREKAAMDYQSGLIEAHETGRQEGRQEGIEIGAAKGAMIGRLQLCQELLGDNVSPNEGLLAQSLDELSNMVSELQSRLRSRKA